MNGVIYSEDASNGARVDSPEWSAFLAEERTFYYDAGGRPGYINFTARCETRRKSCMWYAFVKSDSKQFKAYVGRTATLDGAKLVAVSQHLYNMVHKPKEENVTKSKT